MSDDINSPIDGENPTGGRIITLPIEDELKDAYMTYAMSVIVSRALPDVRDGLKPSQRRILVAMNDLNLSPNSRRVKCAKISGDTSGNYHPHGESVIYPTLVRMAQEWNMRHVLVDKQGNFGSIAGLPPAAMRYTEARLSAVASLMLNDLDMDTVDFIPTYDQERTEPTVLPSKFPNLLVNGSGGIAVGMATSIPPHNLSEVCGALVHMIDHPECSIFDLMEHIKGPDFPTGGVICGQSGVRRGYLTGRSTMTVRARAEIQETKKGRYTIVVTEIPFQQSRDRIETKIADLVREDKIKGISAIRNESDLKEPVRLLFDVKRDADPDVVLSQLYQFSPLQDTFSLITVALVDGKPRTLNLKELLGEFLRHRVTVIRRRTQFLLAKARKRKHTVEGLLIAHANIDEIIRIIRTSPTQQEAKIRLMAVECPSSLLERALGEKGFTNFQDERGVQETYGLTAVQADAILRITLGALVNLEQEKLGNEYNRLLEDITEYLRILSDEANIYAIIREDLEEISKKHGDKRRTEISPVEIGNVNLEDLIEEETMVVTISHQGYIKRTPASTYRAQRRGGKGIKGSKTDTEDPIEHLFVGTTHDYLLFFTTRGKVYWLKIYELPQLARDSKGRALVNLLNLQEDEKIMDCRVVKDFSEAGRCLVMATKNGLVKKTKLEAYARPMKGGIIAIKLKDDDELVDVAITRENDELILSTNNGMAIRFHESDARPMGRNTSGVKGINLSKGDFLAGMVVAEEDAYLLTACANGYGKRTRFGPSTKSEPETEDGAENGEELSSGTQRYRTQKRGGKGLRDIKTTTRNGPVIGVTTVRDGDDVMIITALGKIQRIKADEIGIVGRNTQGVKIMGLFEDDSLVAIVRVPPEDDEEETTDSVTPNAESSEAPAADTASEEPASEENTDGDSETEDSDES